MKSAAPFDERSETDALGMSDGLAQGSQTAPAFRGRRRRRVVALLLVVLPAAAVWWVNSRSRNSSPLSAVESRLVGVWKRSEEWNHAENFGGMMFFSSRRILSVHSFNNGWSELPLPKDRWEASERTISLFEVSFRPRGFAVADWLGYFNALLHGGARRDIQIVTLSDDKLILRNSGGNEYRYSRANHHEAQLMFQILDERQSR